MLLLLFSTSKNEPYHLLCLCSSLQSPDLDHTEYLTRRSVAVSQDQAVLWDVVCAQSNSASFCLLPFSQAISALIISQLSSFSPVLCSSCPLCLLEARIHHSAPGKSSGRPPHLLCFETETLVALLQHWWSLKVQDHGQSIIKCQQRGTTLLERETCRGGIRVLLPAPYL